MKHYKFAILLLPVICGSCVAPTSAITSTSGSQVMIRQAQTRDYEHVSKKQAMRASIATLQDLNFILDKVDADLGAISASKSNVKITITVREKTPMLATIRANATFGETTINDPIIYQDFFSMLDKSLFLVKNRVD